MPPPVATGALLQCSLGLIPSNLTALPRPVLIEGKPAAVITDIAPGVNIAPFGQCMSLANPAVAAATAAALGVLTPMPCLPVVAGPWAPGAARTTISGLPALTAGSLCTCAFGGAISVVFPGTVRTQAN